jgi:hypothetical protein
MHGYTLTTTRPACVNNYRKWNRGKLEVNSLTDANFTGFKIQRNESLKDDKGYSHIWIICYPHKKERNRDTREDGLRILQDCFMSKEGSAYPASGIKVVDDTSDVPEILEKLFLDVDIEDIVKQSFAITELNDKFYSKYPTAVRLIYWDKEPSDYAKMILGFMSIN